MAVPSKKFEPAPDGTFDPAWLIDALTVGGRAEHPLVEKLRACTRYLGADYLMVFFVSPENANQPGAEWQFDRYETLEHAEYGLIYFAMLQDGRIGAVKFLDQVSPDARQRAGARPQTDVEIALLQEALKLGYADAEAMGKFLGAHPEIVELPVSMDESLLHYLAIEDEAEAVRVLLQCGANVNRLSRDGDAILNDTMHASIDTVRQLVEAGADVNYRTRCYGAPLHVVAPPDIETKIDLLLDAGADIYAENNSWETPLNAMVFNGHEDGVRTLLRRGADPNHQSGDGSTAILAFGPETRLKIVEMLAGAGADLKFGGDGCGTVLHSAAYYGKEDVVRYLLRAGLDPHVRRARGENAIDQARRGGHPQIAELLENWGC